MEDQQSSPETQSLGTRIMNVFSSPSEAFADIAGLESKTNLWLVPMLVAIMIGVGISFAVSTNENLRAQIIEMQQRGLDAQVAKGSMTQAQADQQIRAMEQMGMLFAVFGAIFAAIGICFMYFVGTLFLWLLGRFGLGGNYGYSTYLAVFGTAAWIGILGSVVTGMLMIGLNSMFATVGASLAILPDFDPTNMTHKILSKIEVFSLWQASVVGIGLSKLTGKSTGIGIGAAVGLLLVWHAISVMVF